jgi:phosphoribosylaminoimidazole-succinocarboxamide synthase
MATLDRHPDIEGRSKRLWLNGDGTCDIELVPACAATPTTGMS